MYIKKTTNAIQFSTDGIDYDTTIKISSIVGFQGVYFVLPQLAIGGQANPLNKTAIAEIHMLLSDGRRIIIDLNTYTYDQTNSVQYTPANYLTALANLNAFLT